MEERLIVDGREVVVRYADEADPKDPVCLPFLSSGERLAGMLICTVIGWYLQWGSLSRLLQSLRDWDPGFFAVSYSLGNLVSLAGSLFLVSFSRQLQSALAPERRAISGVFFGSLALSLLLPLVLSGKAAGLATLLAVAVQMGSYWVYFLSYFPRAVGALGRSGAGCVALLRRALGR